MSGNFDLSGNSLSLAVPTQLGLLDQMTEYFFLSWNSLSSTIPTQVLRVCVSVCVACVWCVCRGFSAWGVVVVVGCGCHVVTPRHHPTTPIPTTWPSITTPYTNPSPCHPTSSASSSR